MCAVCIYTWYIYIYIKQTVISKVPIMGTDTAIISHSNHSGNFSNHFTFFL